MHSVNEDKSLGALDERETRFKAMLQYLILREACEFNDKFPRDASGAGVKDGLETQGNADEDKFKIESAEKILREMELKFFNLFVEDDLVENYLLHKVLDQESVYDKRCNFKKQIQQHISDKIIVINSIDPADTTDTARQLNKEILKRIVRSPIIENSIMTCDLSIKSKESYLISDINNVFNSSNLASNQDNSLVKIRDEFLSEPENECCKISESSIAIHAHLKTATALGFGFLNLTGKIITKALGDLSGGLFQTDTNGKGKIQVDNTSPSESVRGERITKILTQMDINPDAPPSKSVRGERLTTKISASPTPKTEVIV